MSNDEKILDDVEYYELLSELALIKRGFFNIEKEMDSHEQEKVLDLISSASSKIEARQKLKKSIHAELRNIFNIINAIHISKFSDDEKRRLFQK